MTNNKRPTLLGYTERVVEGIPGLSLLVDDKHYACAVYIGRKTKATYHYRFASIEQREEWLAEKLTELRKQADVKKEMKRKLVQEGNPLQVGDILVCTWGYEQTNCDFYQVTSVSQNMISMREIEKSVCHKTTGSEFDMSGTATPLKGAFVVGTQPFSRKVHLYPGGGVSIHIKSSQYANRWDGQPVFVSWYG
jgi:hypothetical protein